MSLNELVVTGLVKRPRRTLLYGTAGIGKSTFGASADAPIFIQTEDGLNDINCARLPMCTSFAMVIDQMRMLAEQEHEYKTLVVDSADWLERLVYDQTCKVGNKDNIEEFGYGKGYKLALTIWSQFLACCDALREKGLSIVLIAHSQIVKFEDPEGESYDRYSPRLHKDATALITEWCDEVLFATRIVMTKQQDEGFNKKRAVPVGTAERVIKTTESPAHTAKNRLNLPPVLPLDYRAYQRAASGEKTGLDAEVGSSDAA